jgi:hypothetical protein
MRRRRRRRRRSSKDDEFTIEKLISKKITTM